MSSGKGAIALAGKKKGVRRGVLLIPDDHVAFWQSRYPGILEPTGMRALFALRALTREISEVSAGWLGTLGLTPAKYNYLVALYVAPEGRLTLNELSLQIHTSSPAVTGMVAALERDNLIKRKENPNDRRSAFVRLTARGRRVVEQAFPLHHRNIEKALKDVPIADRKRLLDIVLTIARGFERMAE